MKKLQYIFMLFTVALLATGCNDDEFDTGFIENAPAPANVGALFTITQDNTGLVTITPRGEGVSKFEIGFGDSTAEMAEVNVGGRVTHTYAEGVYQVTIKAIGVTGKVTEVTEELTVSFIPPANLEVVISPVAGNSFGIDVTASADYETYFEVWFGEDPEQAPVQFMEGETISHTYSATGTYDVTVVAYSGGAATTEVVQQVTIANPLLLPITFENSSLTYTFGDFGNAATSVVENPDISGINTSATVGQSIKNNGAETWAGTAITLDGTIDFTTLQYFRVKVWSPAAGVTVKFKIENLTNADINYEVDQVTTVANQWEYLTYDFSGANFTQEFSKVILFFNFGQTGSGDTYYFDDIRQTDGSAPYGLPVTFELDEVNYSLLPFGNATSAVIANPDPSGINTSAMVGEFVKPAGAETWAGVTLPLTDPMDFSAYNTFKVKVWSPEAGSTVLLKLENYNDPIDALEIPATTTVANAWEELEFTFEGIQNNVGYQKIILFFDFNEVGTGTTYYFDDITLTN